MNIIISNNSSVPIYEQIKNAIKDAIISNELKEEEMLPSVRNLANDLKISFLTVKKAYDELEQEEFIKTVQGKGTFVAPKNLEIIKEESSKYTSENIEEFRKYCSTINYKKIEEKMQLIKTNSIDIFINYTIKIDGQEVNGKDIFRKYVEIYEDRNISYSERKVKLSPIAEKLNLFVYSLPINSIQQIEGEKICGMYYVEEGKKYIKDGRFNRGKYIEEGEGLFL